MAHDPKDMDARDALGMCLLALGRHAEAMPHLRQVVAAQPDNANARTTSDGACWTGANTRKQSGCTNTSMNRRRGGLQPPRTRPAGEGQAVAAAQCFQTAIQLVSTNRSSSAPRAGARATGKAEDADKHYSRAVELDPANAGFRPARLVPRLERQHRGAESVPEALQREPEHERGAAGLAAVLHRRRELDVLSCVRSFRLSILSLSP